MKWPKFFAISVAFKWYDLWIGAYWDRHENRLYLCPLPCLVIRLTFGIQVVEDLIEKACDRAARDPFSAWSDQNCDKALAINGPEGVSILNCPDCGADSYFNPVAKYGVHFTCHHCGRLFQALDSDEPPRGPCPVVRYDRWNLRFLEDVMHEMDVEEELSK